MWVPQWVLYPADGDMFLVWLCEAQWLLYLEVSRTWRTEPCLILRGLAISWCLCDTLCVRGTIPAALEELGYAPRSGLRL